MLAHARKLYGSAPVTKTKRVKNYFQQSLIPLPLTGYQFSWFSRTKMCRHGDTVCIYQHPSVNSWNRTSVGNKWASAKWSPLERSKPHTRHQSLQAEHTNTAYELLPNLPPHAHARVSRNRSAGWKAPRNGNLRSTVQEKNFLHCLRATALAKKKTKELKHLCVFKTYRQHHKCKESTTQELVLWCRISASLTLKGLITKSGKAGDTVLDQVISRVSLDGSASASASE